jgi:WD40 repeat protein
MQIYAAHRTISASDDGTLRIWKLDSGQELSQVKGLAGQLKTVVVIHRDVDTAIVAGTSKLLCLCNLETGKVESTLSGPLNPIVKLSSYDKGQKVVALDDHGIAYAWDLMDAKPKCVQIPKHPAASGPLRQIRLQDESGELWASGEFPGLVRWTVEGWKPDGQLATNSPVRAFGISADNKYLLAAADSTFCTARRNEADDFEITDRAPHKSNISTIERAIGYCDDHFALVGADGSVELWRARDERSGGTFPASVEAFTTALFSAPEGAILTAHADGTLRLWSFDAALRRPEEQVWVEMETYKKLLEEQKYDELTQRIDQFRKTRAFYETGFQKTKMVYGQLSSRADDGDWPTRQSTIAKWRQAKPTSIAPMVVQAEALMHEGWEARGNGVAMTVTQPGWKIFDEKLNEALKVIDDAQQLDEKDADLFGIQIQILMGLGSPIEDVDAAFKKGVAIDPDCASVYEAGAIRRLARWGGGDGEIAKWTGRVCDDRKDRGDEMYARVAISLLQYDSRNFFGETQMDWNRIKRGLEKLLATYGDSAYFANAGGFLAVLNLDHETAQRTLPILGLSRHNSRYWGDGQQLRRFQKWAAADPPPPGQEQKLLLASTLGADCAALSAGGDLLVVCGNGGGGILQIRETRNWQTVFSRSGIGTDFSVLAVHPDGPFIATAGGPIAPLNAQPKSYSCGAEIFNFTQGQPEVHGLFGQSGHTAPIKALAFSPDGAHWATGSLDKSVRVWQTQKIIPRAACIATPSEVSGIAYLADGKSICAATLHDGAALWDIGTEQQVLALPNSADYTAEEGRALATSHTGSLVAYLTKDHRVSIYDAATKTAVTTLPVIEGKTFALSFSPDDKWLATAGDSKKIELWDASSGKPLHTFLGHFDTIRSLSFFPDGDRLLTLAEDATIRIWDASQIAAEENHDQH